MSTPRRTLLPEVAVGLLICGGAYFFGLRPVEQRLAAAHDRAGALVAQGFGAGPVTAAPSAEELIEVANDIAARARELGERGREAFDGSAMFAAFTALAQDHGLMVEQLQPNTPPARPRPPGPLPEPGQPPPPDDQQAGYTLTVRGEYHRVAGFLRRLAERFPGSSVVHVRVAPSDGPGGPVVVVISTLHRTFDTSEVIRLAEAALHQPE